VPANQSNVIVRYFSATLSQWQLVHQNVEQ
jgi:hypothetical protein